MVGAGSVSLVLVLVLAKALAYGISLGCGYRGGPIFPAIFLGVGLAAVAVVVLGTSPTLAVAVGAAAGMAAQTRLLLLIDPAGGTANEKDAVRALAREAGLPVADKRESQDLCFVAGLGGRAFLQRHGGPALRRPGEIVDRQGTVLGSNT